MNTFVYLSATKNHAETCLCRLKPNCPADSSKIALSLTKSSAFKFPSAIHSFCKTQLKWGSSFEYSIEKSNKMEEGSNFSPFQNVK